MRILFTSYWYYPEPVSKPHSFATAMVERGHQVTVITGFPNYPQGKLYPGYRMRWRQQETIDGVSVIRVPMVIDHSRSGARRTVSYMSYALMVAASRWKVGHRPDLVWSYQIGLPGILLGRLLRVPVVHEVQDLWPEWSQTGHMGIGGLIYSVLDAEERSIYRQASAITTISDGFRQTLVAKGVPQEKITVLPNWANEQICPTGVRDTAFAAREALTGRFNIIYGGNIGTAQGLGVVLDAAEMLREYSAIQFVMIGDGVELEPLRDQALERGLANVRFLGSRRPDQMPGYLVCADALLLHLKRNPAYAITIPSKTYTYLSAGRPIVAAAEGDVANLVQEIGVGLVCSPENPAELARSVTTLYELPESAREAMGRKGRHASVTRFSRSTTVGKYEVLFQKIVAGR